MISTYIHRCHDKLLVLERAEATAMYCSKLINNVDAEDIGFMQIQLNTNLCLLIMNRAPSFAYKSNDKQVRESWSGIYKYSKSENFPFDLMDITCENLWKHVQRHQQNLLKRCERHRLSNLFFNSKNMQVFNKLLRVYFSTVDVLVHVLNLRMNIQFL